MSTLDDITLGLTGTGVDITPILGDFSYRWQRKDSHRC